jgi:hypothetical protein
MGDKVADKKEEVAPVVQEEIKEEEVKEEE